MVTWSCDDRVVITAVSNATLCVWNPDTTQLVQRLEGHKDEVRVGVFGLVARTVSSRCMYLSHTQHSQSS